MTLQRAVDCTHKEAVDFATTVDREVHTILLSACRTLCMLVHLNKKFFSIKIYQDTPKIHCS